MRFPIKIITISCVMVAVAALAASPVSPLQYLQDKVATEITVTTASADNVIGGPFTLTNQDDVRVTDKDFLGHYMLVFFGFTHCPDICPTQLQTIKAALTKLGDKAPKITPVFISVDYERDTPSVLKDYLTSYPGTVGLTGAPGEIDAVTARYKVFYKKVDDIYWVLEQQLPAEEKAKITKPRSNNYSVDHSAYIFLMGPDGKFIDLYSFGTTPDELATKLKQKVY